MRRGVEGYVSDPLRLNTRLGKFPQSCAVVVDKGYKGHAVFWPKLNRHVLPTFLESRSQFEVEELEDDLETKRIRYTSETLFSRGQTQRILKGVVDYGDLAIVDDVYSFAMGCANLMLPLRNPYDWNEYVASLSRPPAPNVANRR